MAVGVIGGYGWSSTDEGERFQKKAVGKRRPEHSNSPLITKRTRHKRGVGGDKTQKMPLTERTRKGAGKCINRMTISVAFQKWNRSQYLELGGKRKLA